MYAVKGEGLSDLLSVFSMIGATHGEISSENCTKIMPHPTTITRNVHVLAQAVAKTLADVVQPIYSRFGGAITLDLWSDKFRKRTYLGVTSH